MMESTDKPEAESKRAKTKTAGTSNQCIANCKHVRHVHGRTEFAHLQQVLRPTGQQEGHMARGTSHPHSGLLKERTLGQQCKLLHSFFGLTARGPSL